MQEVSLLKPTMKIPGQLSKLHSLINNNLVIIVIITFRVIGKHFDSRIPLFGRRVSRKKKLSYLSLRLLYRVNCNPGMVLSYDYRYQSSSDTVVRD